MDANRGFNSLYVYCDAAEEIPLGDIKAPFLHVVDAAGNFGDIIHRLYYYYHYYYFTNEKIAVTLHKKL